jgi:hypothetical protein
MKKTVGILTSVYARKLRARRDELTKARLTAKAKYLREVDNWRRELAVFLRDVAATAAINAPPRQRRYSDDSWQSFVLSGAPKPPSMPDYSKAIDRINRRLRGLAVIGAKYTNPTSDELDELFGDVAKEDE